MRLLGFRVLHAVDPVQMFSAFYDVAPWRGHDVLGF